MAVIRTIIFFALTICIVSTFAHTPAAASEVRVLVNNKPITDFDIDQQIRMTRLIEGGRTISRDQALQEMIDQRVMQAAAERYRVRISDQEVNARISAVAANTPLNTRERFLQALQSEMGIRARTVEEYIRTQMAWGEIVRALRARELQVSEREVDMFLTQKNEGADQGEVTEYLIQQIVVVVPGSANANQRAELRRQAENVRTRFTSCEDMARQRGALQSVVIRDVGWRNEGTLTEEELGRLRNVAINKTSAVFNSEFGFEILAVCNTRSSNDNVRARREAENSLQMERGGMVAEKLLRDMRANAIIQYR